MRRVLFAAIMLTSAAGYVVSAKAEQPVMAYPQMYKFMTDTASGANSRTYLHCDDATDACERGVAWEIGNRVFEAVSGADHTTVVGHGACHSNPNGSWVCWNFDKGVYSGFVNGAAQEGKMTAPDAYNWPYPRIW